MTEQSFVEDARKQVEKIEEWFYKGLDGGMWDVNLTDQSDEKPQSRKKKKSSHKKKRQW